jgi:hypothetical protein
MTTLASSIITDAYRESNIIPMGNTPTTNQQTEALGRLNTLLHSTLGNEVGDALYELIIGGSNSQAELLNDYIPDNTRLVLNLAAATTFKLDPYPFEGQRLAIVDVLGNLATYPLTLSGNGHQIEGVSSLVLSTNSYTGQWIYRGDVGGWVKFSTLLLTDQIPFPTRFDDYFITMLAMRLNPRYGQSMAPESLEALKRARSQIRSFYHAYVEVRSDLDTRGYLSDPRGYWSVEDSDFKTGKPFSWR